MAQASTVELEVQSQIPIAPIVALPDSKDDHMGLKDVNKIRKTDARKEHADSFGKTALMFFWHQWFIVLFAVTILVSYLAPNVARRGGYLATQYTFSYGALVVIFFVAGLTMPTKVLWNNLGQWKVHVITQSMCFIIIPLIGVAIVEIINASKDNSIVPLIKAGIIVMLCTPTTVASNITFTRTAGGDDAAALIEVTIGNLLGIFITPALIQLFLRPSLGFVIGRPTQGPGLIYKELIKHFGLALYLPLFVGQVLRNIWPAQADQWSQKLRLPKWASVCLLLLLWETFSDAFHSRAFSTVPAQSIILVVFLNLGLYPFFTLLCFLICRPPFTTLRISKGQTTAVCFCGPPKSITVGIVLIYVQYSNFSTLDQAVISIP